MCNTPDCKGLFSELFRSKESQYRLWVNQAEFQLRLKTKYLIGKYSTGEDIVQDIITGVLCGRIHWDQEKVSLRTFMYHQIRSQVSNLLKRELSKLTPTRAEYERTFPKYVDAEQTISCNISDISRKQDLDERIRIILEKLENDPIAYFVFEEMIKGSTNQDIAEVLKMDIHEVVKAKRRIKSVIRKLI
jgi:DNA-directed RNA polymerase specialized sigma24 family protein